MSPDMYKKSVMPYFALLFNSHLLGKHTKEKTNDLGIKNKANKQKAMFRSPRYN